MRPAALASATEAAPASARAFDHLEFRWFIASRFVNALGTNIMMPTLGWQIYAFTRDPAALGLIGLAVFLPVAAAALPAGQAADRLERRAVYRFAQLLLACCGVALTLLSWSGTHKLLPFYLAAALFGWAKTFSAPTATAWMPHLVAREAFPNAVIWSSSSFQLSSTIGPAVAGLLLYLAGETAAYAVVALLYLAAFVAAGAVRTRSRGADAGGASFAHLFGGFSYIRSHRIILGVVTLDLFAVLLGGVTAMLPAFAHGVLNVSEAGFGFLRSAPSMGAAATALVLAHRPFNRRVGAWMFGSVVVFGVSTILFALSTSFALSIAALLVLGSADMVGGYVRQTVVQLGTHDDMRGRVSSINMLFGSARNELGDMQTGFLASLLGVVPAIVFGGGCTLAVAAFWAWWFPELRRTNGLTDHVTPLDSTEEATT